MKKMACALGLLVACGGSAEDVGSSSQALTLPTQPFPGFIIPGLVGATSGFGAPTPIGLATTAGLGAGTVVNIENLINSSGVYHNDYGWYVPASRDQICNLAATSICLSGVPPVGSTSVVLTTSSDPNSFAFTWQGGMFKSAITGNCIQAAALANGAALHWAACSAGTPFAGVGFNVTYLTDTNLSTFFFANGLTDQLETGAGSRTFVTAMDAAYYQLVGYNTGGTTRWIYNYASNDIGWTAANNPATCTGSVTKASWAPTMNGVGSPCAGTWTFGSAGSLMYNGPFGSFTDQNITASYF